MEDEKILHHAKVHYILYFPGIFAMLASLAVAYSMPDIADFFVLVNEAREKAVAVGNFIAGSIFMGAVAMLLRAWLQVYSTELVVTNRRVLVKIGISTATTAEIDRERISSVVVTKPIMGRMLDYGWITILGYSGNITGLPLMAKPHDIQKYIYQKQPK